MRNRNWRIGEATRKWWIGGAALVVVVVAFGAVAASASGVAGVSLLGSRPKPETSATALAGAPSTPTPEPAVGTIADLVAQYGYPAGYDMGQIRIPVLGVDAPFGASYVDGSADAELVSPEGPATVLWYDMSAWTGLGGQPGEGRNAIFGGHVDISSYLAYADVTYHGPAVFRDLYLLAPGDRVFVDYNGETLEYVVSWSEQVGAGDSNRWGEIWSSNVASDSITLYTCGGTFDSVSRSYADRLVVRAERV